MSAGSVNEEQARAALLCPGCSRPKTEGLVVCWDCFKGRTPGVMALKDFEGTFDTWFKAVTGGVK